ncbi:VOC family protein [Actinorugispora endophytica]|uniref:VOC domain-containing protein n=1 Tax=Actinorugispora endophytica TaxID=1605990 RepID=A0A4R6V0G3_9ACTN|nr:VOC family protein [Actinorugispora endophytica]TDQ52093.1 hypothetical protein EV190_10874 [Actinorugispora endophytica]
MSEITAYPPGAPAWFDMTVPDLGSAQRFYSTLLGWEFDEGPYSLAGIGGRRVAGLAEPWGDAPPPEQSNWTVYLSTNDIDATLAAVREAGGSVVSGRGDMPGIGSMAIIREPTGTVCALWQGDGLPGTEASGVPGAPVWSEVTSTDTAAATDFLVSVFGYETERTLGFDYVTLYSGGEPVCGVYGGSDGRVHRGHGAWLPYFAVRNADAAGELAEREGGKILRGAENSPYGRWAMLADPVGAHFAVVGSADR